MRRYLTVAETARKLGVSEKAVRARIARRQIPYKKFGWSIMIPEPDLDVLFDGLAGVSVEEALAAAGDATR